MIKIKTVAAYLTGYAQTKSAVGEVKTSASLSVNFFRGIWTRIQDLRREAKVANALAAQDDKGLWDEMCRQYEVTTQSVRLKYRAALFTNLILVLGVGLIVGNLLSNIDAGAMMVFANVVFLNLVLMILFQNLSIEHGIHTVCSSCHAVLEGYLEESDSVNRSHFTERL